MTDRLAPSPDEVRALPDVELARLHGSRPDLATATSECASRFVAQALHVRLRASSFARGSLPGERMRLVDVVKCVVLIALLAGAAVGVLALMLRPATTAVCP